MSELCIKNRQCAVLQYGVCCHTTVEKVFFFLLFFAGEFFFFSSFAMPERLFGECAHLLLCERFFGCRSDFILFIFILLYLCKGIFCKGVISYFGEGVHVP